MTTGSVLALPATLAIAAAPTLAWFGAAWMVAGVAMAAVLYPPAFAALTRWYGDRRDGALTVLTLVAGLSSTIFAPLTVTLLDRLSWRATYVVLAVLLGVVTIPAHGLLLALPWQDAGHHRRHNQGSSEVASVLRGRRFLLLTAGMTVAVFACSRPACP
jgi:MFS family permease